MTIDQKRIGDSFAGNEKILKANSMLILVKYQVWGTSCAEAIVRSVD